MGQVRELEPVEVGEFRLQERDREELLSAVGSRLIRVWIPGSGEQFPEYSRETILISFTTAEDGLIKDVEAALARYQAMQSTPRATRSRGRPHHAPSRALAREAMKIYDRWVRAPRSSGGNTLTTWQRFMAALFQAAGAPIKGEKLARTIDQIYPYDDFDPRDFAWLLDQESDDDYDDFEPSFEPEDLGWLLEEPGDDFDPRDHLNNF